MSTNQSNQPGGEERPRRSDETQLRSTPVAEKIKRAHRRGLGGNKAILALSAIAVVLGIVVIIMLAQKFIGNGSDEAETLPPTELVTGTVATLPEGAVVYLKGDSLGVTPLSFSADEDAEITIIHPCCPDTIVEVDFESFEEAPVLLQTKLEIRSEPEGASININGDDTGEKTPYTFTIAATDTFDLVLGYTDRAQIKTGALTVSQLFDYSHERLELDRSPDGGFLLNALFAEEARPKKTLITSYPTGATVALTESGTRLGTTPLRYDFPSNTIKLTISKDGFSDRPVTLPLAESRRQKYAFDLFRRVEVFAYEKGQPRKTVECTIMEVIYRDRSHLEDVTYGEGDKPLKTPANLRLPGVETRLVLAADGYYDSDTLISPFQKEITVVMRKKSTPSGTLTKPSQQTDESEIPAGHGLAQIFVVDKKSNPVKGVSIRAENRKTKEILDLGKTDREGKLTIPLKPAKYKFIALHIEYKKADKSRSIREAESEIIKIKIKKR